MITLSDMKNIVRRMTARYTPEAMQDTQIESYLNKAYTLHMPLSFKNLKLTKPYSFLTIPNVDTYPFPYENGLPGDNPGNFTINPPVFCQGYPLRFYQNKQIFQNRWPKLSVNQQIGVGGNLANVAYTGTIVSYPFLRAQLDIFGNVTEPAVIVSAFDDTGFTYTLTDVPVASSNTGNLAESDGTVVGTVNYLTGAYTFTLSNNSVIPATATIYAAVVPYQASRPTDVLFYDYQLVFRPVPLQVYQVEFEISRQPTELILDSDFPELDEWYLFLCAWAAKLIYTEFPDPEGMAYLQPIWEEQQLIAQRRSLRQMSSQRAQTLFTQPVRPLAGYFYGTDYSGSL